MILKQTKLKVYFPTAFGAATNQLQKITSFSGITEQYTYDKYGYINTKKTTIDSINYTDDYDLILKILKTFSQFGNRFKIMNKTNFLFIILFFSLSSCKINRTYNHLNTIKCDLNSNSSFNVKVHCFKTKAKNLVFQQLGENGISMKGCKIIYRAYALIDEIDINCLKKTAFSQKLFLNSISFSTGFSSLMILDEEGKYIARSSDDYTYTNLENFTFYDFDMKLIEKYVEKDYDIIFELFGACRNEIIFGYSNNLLEIYEYNENTLIPLSFEEFKSKCIL